MTQATFNPELLIDSNRGIYIPQVFAQNFEFYILNKEELREDLNILISGPENEEYDESWSNVLDNCKLTNDKGEEMYLYQSDGDLWAVKEGEEVPDMF